MKETLASDKPQELWDKMKELIDKGMAQDALHLVSNDSVNYSPSTDYSYRVMIQVARAMVINH